MKVDINSKITDDGSMIRRNSLKAWVLAARPKTLSGASVPVMLGTSVAYHTMGGRLDNMSQFVLAAVLCFLFAFIMQIDANFINDYYDCLKGRDNEERIGPLRACQQGWITMSAMRIGIVFTTFLASLVGLAMFWAVDDVSIMLNLVFIGALCIVFCFLYTTCLASWGLGDLLVLIFFGIIPVCGTYYVEVSDAYRSLSQIPWVMGIACGLVVDTLLIVNNYRDYYNDKKAQKRTLVVFIGKKYSEYLYLFLPTIALVAVLLLYGWTNLNIILCFGVYFLFTQTWNQMRAIGEGKELNKVLGKTARNIFAFGILISLLVNLQ